MLFGSLLAAGLTLGFAPAGAAAMAAQAQALARYASDPNGWYARLKEIKAPVLALTGAEDASAASTKTIHESIPGSDFVSISSASHIANVEQPEAFNRALRDFLSAPASARA